MVPERVGIDETSFQKRHEYVTVVVDLDDGKVLYAGDDRKRGSLDAFDEGIGEAVRKRIRAVAMDTWKPYIASTRAHVSEADGKIAFDEFHVAALLGKAVDTVRRQEHRALIAAGDATPAKAGRLWLTNPGCMSEEHWKGRFRQLPASTLKTARAWAIKEEAMGLWWHGERAWARKAWEAWLGWALRSRLDPVLKAARTVRDHLWGILNAIVLGATNAMRESVNAGIQRVKRMACGFRNRDRFRRAICFHLARLDLYPFLPPVTHTDS